MKESLDDLALATESNNNNKPKTKKFERKTKLSWKVKERRTLFKNKINLPHYGLSEDERSENIDGLRHSNVKHHNYKAKQSFDNNNSSEEFSQHFMSQKSITLTLLQESKISNMPIKSILKKS